MWVWWESLKHGVELIYWKVRWRFQDLSYLERIVQQLMIKGGGVALYVRNVLQVVECDDLNSKLCESIRCKIYVESIDQSVCVIEVKRRMKTNYVN